MDCQRAVSCDRQQEHEAADKDLQMGCERGADPAARPSGPGNGPRLEKGEMRTPRSASGGSSGTSSARTDDRVLAPDSPGDGAATIADRYASRRDLPTLPKSTLSMMRRRPSKLHEKSAKKRVMCFPLNGPWLVTHDRCAKSSSRSGQKFRQSRSRGRKLLHKPAVRRTPPIANKIFTSTRANEKAARQ